MAHLLQPGDITGAWSIFPTPAKPNASDWRATDTVDLAETARALDAMIDAGVDGVLSMGTLGECATLTWDEKQGFIKTLTATARGRIPVFVGTTALNTRDTITQMQFARNAGATGTMLGLPMWCASSLETAVQFYRDVAEAVPDLNIAVYANAEAFKFDFPRPFWAQVAEIPQVVTAKYSGIGTLMPDLNNTRGKMKLLPLDFDYFAAARIDDGIDAFWSSGAACGPGVATQLRDMIAEARRTGNWQPAAAFGGRVAATGAPLFPNGSFKDFSTYNISLEKARIDAAGWMKAGPVRPPYYLTPEAYLEGARRSGQMWAELASSLNKASAAA